MEISEELAEHMVIEMKKIINKDLNFINSQGIIMASTDKKRIGTYHEGGKKAIQLDKVIVVNKDEEYPGAKKGLNIPIKFYENIIGVIGISGDKKEVEKFGEIIKRMTEILVKEAYLIKKEEIENEREKILLEKIIFKKSDDFNEDTIQLKKIKSKNNFIIFLEKIEITNNYNFEKLKHIFVLNKEIIKNYDGYLMIDKNLITCLLFEKNYKNLEKIIEKIKNKTQEKDISFTFGVSEIKNNFRELKSAYDESKNALEWGIKNKKKLVFYNNLDLELILNELNEDVKSRYIKKIFKNLTIEEIKKYEEIFQKYEFYNGSLKKIANSLFMHVNTLQYKLNKFKDETDLDIRNYQDFCKIKLAFMLI